MQKNPVMIWFRRELRLEDNAGLLLCAFEREAVIPIFIWSPEEEGKWAPGGASRWWLHHSLAALAASLQKKGLKLILRRGPEKKTLLDLARETGATDIWYDLRWDPPGFERDIAMTKAFLGENSPLRLRPHSGRFMNLPPAPRSGAGTPYKVFTAYWKAARKLEPAPAPGRAKRLAIPETWPRSESLESLGLLPKIDWAAGLREAWRPGEAGAQAALKAFVKEAMQDYVEGRDRPGLRGTSRLSPHLAFGEISPLQIVSAIRELGAGRGAEAFERQIYWREFAYHLLHHFPETPDKPLRPEFEKFPWRSDPKGLRAWQRGETGYPIVDAGMRELWHTGWMHNRVRMIVASFLVKDLLIDWREGARWFWDTLVDADLANNTLGWQWVAGCGADAAPYFRVFNPTLQGEKFDPASDYVRRWVPELSRLGERWIHRPWEAPAAELKQAGVQLGRDYPKPIVDHAFARDRALAAYAKIKKSGRSAG